MKCSILYFSVRITGVLRDCATQKHEYHAYKDGAWSPQMEILEPYQEGCTHTDDKGERITPTRWLHIIFPTINLANKRTIHLVVSAYRSLGYVCNSSSIASALPILAQTLFRSLTLVQAHNYKVILFESRIIYLWSSVKFLQILRKIFAA